MSTTLEPETTSPLPAAVSAAPSRQKRSLGRWIVRLLILAAIISACWFGYTRLKAEDESEALTWTAEKTDLRITVTERGTLQSQKTEPGICEIEGYDNKIIFIVEEGSSVKKGQVVVRFDSSEIDREVAEERLEVTQAKAAVETTKQEIDLAKNTAESEIDAAKLELTLAILDLEKYEKGDYLVEVNDFKGKIALAEVELEKAQEALQNTKELVKKGFREPEQIRTAEQTVESAKFNLERDKRQLKVLEDYDFKRKQTEFKAKAKEAERKVVRAKSNAKANLRKANSAHENAQQELKIQEEEFAEVNKQLERCEIKAAQDGVVAYANEEWWSESRRIREGGTVYERQTVFFIPDMKLMQVEVKVHESEVKRVAAGQKAIVRVDAFSNKSFTGTVKTVAQLSQSDGFLGAGVKEYTCIITIDDSSAAPLRPGMTAEVEILVDSLSDKLAVPVQAVAEHNRQHYVYRRTRDGFENQEVKIGSTNNRMIVIESGIDPGTVVALDARRRAVEEFGDQNSGDSAELLQLEKEGGLEAAKQAEKKPETKEAAETKEKGDSAEKKPDPPADAKTDGSSGDADKQESAPKTIGEEEDGQANTCKLFDGRTSIKHHEFT